MLTQNSFNESHSSEPGAFTEAVLAALLSFRVDSGGVSWILSTGAADLRGEHKFAPATFLDVGRTLSTFPRTSGGCWGVCSSTRLPRMPKILNTASTIKSFCPQKRGKHIFQNTQVFSFKVVVFSAAHVFALFLILCRA
jgi:hypothetical protein